MTDLKNIAEALVNLQGGNMKRLRKIIEDEYGIKPNTQALENCDYRMNRAERRRAAREQQRNKKWSKKNLIF